MASTIFNIQSPDLSLFSCMATPRILLCGDVLGRLNQLFKRVSTVNKSAGPFDALLCVGQFFPDSLERVDEFNEFIEGRSQIPLPTYFIGDFGVGAAKVLLAASRDFANQGFKMDGLKICHNLYWLKGSGRFTLHGLSVAYLSGKHSSDAQQFGVYSQDDVDALRAIAEEPGVVDIFLTNEWPTGVTNRASPSDIPPGISDSFGSDSTIAELVAEIKPRYHIAGSKGVYYAREPYSNIDAVHITRFLGLASVGNKEKQKFIHAISPTPASKMSAAEISMKSTNTTLSPYSLAQDFQQTVHADAAKRSNDSVSDSQYWRYDVSQKRQKHGAGDGHKMCFKYVSSGSCPRGEKCHFQHDMDARDQYLKGVCFDFINKGKCERGPDCNFKHSFQKEDDSYSNRRRGSENATNNRSKECWFCLSSPNVESHLIVSIGENIYCALAKGPLVQDHVLVIPVEHLSNTFSLPPECEIDLGRFQNSLKKYYSEQGKEVVFFEWVSKRSTHANIQAIPVPSSRAAAAQNVFNLAAKKLGFSFVAKKVSNYSDGRNYLRTQFDRNFSFYYVELPDGTILSHLVEENEIFPAQFGREVLAGLLNMADRADWRSCTYSKEEETKMAEEFKSRFQAFDPNE
ncbi:zinc finger CCCH domain-containing protein 64 isoform X1 [Ziziphus jujuba]|uniref:Zinc finger CCCH domain-containing protein 64 isoform X1 n=1 Tax=Ziziphus jujuba TaxID=326968 RepID=A0ABM3IUI4_ZIZJJ|nr:zinc finger CCCH domain-containing protein 64 isoform X1 [Ziziphus jujuba]XP_048335671.2 zinc finger CCCH domain-containing protein 64 isoform X1 [Ziziphus jujuba]